MIERGEKMRVLVCHTLPPVHFLMPDSVALSNQNIWYAQAGQASKAAATLMSKDQATS